MSSSSAAASTDPDCPNPSSPGPNRAPRRGYRGPVAELDRLFTKPPRDFGPTPLWWWSGEEVTTDRMTWQLHRFAEGGIYNLVVINLAPAGPTFGAPPDRPAWFSDAWWDRFTEACQLAQNLDLRLWFYDQIGFSGANIQGRITLDHPQAKGRRLRHRVSRAVEGRVRLHGGELLLAGYVEGRRIDCRPDGSVDVPDGRDVELMISAPTAFDYLNRDATELLLDLVHREYEQRVPQFLGSVIPGSFQDELPNTNAWTANFAERFADDLGYDLLDHGRALFEDSPGFAGDGAAKVRGDYYAVRGRLTEEAFFKPLAQWHTERGLLIGADQSNPARAGYPTQSTQIYTDYFRTHRWYGAVGSDHEGDSKVHSSMAHLYHHPRVWVESFHSSGWGGTLEETYDWLLPFLRSGGNLYNPHASYFSTVAGWFEWAPPSTDWRQPYWAQYRLFADAVSRICSIMSWGTYDAEVAVLHPTATAQAGSAVDHDIAYFGDSDLGNSDVDRAQRCYLELCGTNDWFDWRPSALDRSGIAFDVIDDDSVQRADTDNGRIAVAGQSYSTVLLPGTAVLEEESARQLINFLDRGGRVIAVGVRPRLAAGRAGDDGLIVELTRHPRLEFAASVDEAIEQLDPTDQHVYGDLPLLVRRDGSVGAALITGTHPSATDHPARGPGQAWVDYDFDRRRYADSQTIMINAPVVEAEAWNPATGEQRPVTITQQNGRSEIVLRQDGAPAWILVWREGAGQHAIESVPSPAPITSVPIDEDSWIGRPIPTLDNTWGDLARPVGRDLADPELWHVEVEDVDGGWRRTRATFGQTVLITADPVDPLTAEQCAAVIDTGTALGGAGWHPYHYSADRGADRDPIGALGTKGLVPAEFVFADRPAPEGSVGVRALISTEHRGPAELIVYAGAAKQVWWNGVEVSGTPGYYCRTPIEVDRAVNVLEYRLSQPELQQFQLPLGSGFTVAQPDGFTERSEYMRAESTEPVAGDTIRFARELAVGADAEDATLVVGTGVATTILIDERVVGRQERVEYYDSDARSAPEFFRYDVTALLTSGQHRLELIMETSDPAEVCYVDLVALTPVGPSIVVSGVGWQTTNDGRSGRSVVSPLHWRPTESAYAMLRPHPLPRAQWLRGDPPVGRPSLDIAVSDTAATQNVRLRRQLPSGTRWVAIPTRTAIQARIDGDPVSLDDNMIRLNAPLQRPAELEVHGEPTAFAPGASILDGPIIIGCEPAPIRLGEWSTIGLGDWSGAVSYTTEVEPPPDQPWQLDLGDLRGSVAIALDGELVAEAFCAPFRFSLPPCSGRVRLEIIVYNTLGPYLQASTPTNWVFDSQLASGLFGPVTITAGRGL